MLYLASSTDIHCALLHGLRVLTAHRYLVPINSMRTGSWSKEKIQISNFHETMLAKLALFHYFTLHIQIATMEEGNQHLCPIRQVTPTAEGQRVLLPKEPRVLTSFQSPPHHIA